MNLVKNWSDEWLLKPSEEKIPVEEFVEKHMQGPLIFSESETALAELKTKKAKGPDGIFGELLKSLGSTGKQELCAICNEIYETWAWPNDFMESVIIPIEKNSGVQECVDFRTISLVSHA